MSDVLRLEAGMGGRRYAIGVLTMLLAMGSGTVAQQQSGQSAAAASRPIMIPPPLPPATALEGFTAPPGSLLTVGHEHIGEVAGISVEVREMRNSLGQRARGVVVTVPGPPERQQAFIDEDELDGLLKGFDTLLAITGNPTALRNFETSYATKGELVIRAETYRTSGITYSIETGRLIKADAGPLDVGQMQQLRTLISAASRRLATLPPIS
jgi:hypothetical protein